MFRDFLGKEWDCKCMGCAMGTGEITPPGGVIASTENFIIHQDPEIPIPGFLIIASKKHIYSISQLDPQEANELFALVYRARKALADVKGIREVTIIQEERSRHFHLWLLPRYDWMLEGFDNSLSTIRGILAFAKENYKTEENIAEILATVEALRSSLA